MSKSTPDRSEDGPPTDSVELAISGSEFLAEHSRFWQRGSKEQAPAPMSPSKLCDLIVLTNLRDRGPGVGSDLQPPAGSYVVPVDPTPLTLTGLVERIRETLEPKEDN